MKGSMQTLWDSGQQFIRILLYVVAGGFLREGWLDESTMDLLIGSVLGILNGAWTVYWNRREVVTVSGIQAAAAAPEEVSPVTHVTARAITAAKA